MVVRFSRSRDLAFSLTLYPNQRTHNDEIEIVLGDHQLGEGVSHCQRANHSSSSVTLSVFCSVGHCRSSRVFPSNRSTVTEVILVRFSREIGRSWPVGCICEVIGLLCCRTVPRTFYVKENQILKRGPQLPQSDSAVTINCSGTVIALLSSSVRAAK